MKVLHRPDVFAWSRFDEPRNIDFHGYALVRAQGVVLVDPLPMSDHDLAHLDALGRVTTIVITNSDHVRAAADFAARSGAEIVGPTAERDGFPIRCDRWASDGVELVPGVVAIELHGSKTPGELALFVDGSTLITGDLIRAHRAGALTILPDAKLEDRLVAIESVVRLAAITTLDAVLVGDGWPIFRDGRRALRELADSLTSAAR